MAWQKVNAYNSTHQYPVHADVDILVCGGGSAGVAAAEAAARKGNKVLLIEKYGFLGGAAVAGLSGTICGLFLASDNQRQPKQVVFGFADTFYQALKNNNGCTAPQIYGKTWTVTHDPHAWRETGEGLVLAAGAKILYHADIIGVIKDDDQFKGVIVNTKSGIAAIHARVVIDATGDADLIYRAGLDYTMGDQGRIQNPTMIFRANGVDVEKFLAFWGEDTISQQNAIDLLHKASVAGLDLPRKKIWIFDTPRPDQLLVNATRIVGSDGRDLDVTDPVDHSEAEICGRHQVREYARFLKEYIPGCEDSYINDTGVEVGVRQTRSIVGCERLTNDDVLNKRKRPDGIARSPWPIELHYGEKPKVEWLLDDYYEVPYGALVPIVGENIIVAGRCLSAEHEAMASARVTAQCFQYGEVAGLAADLALKSGTALRQIDGAQIRELMNKAGADL